MDMRRLVGRNFARIRRAKGLTQEQVEERSGHSQQYLSSLERGRRNPTVVTLYELAQALGVDHVDLVQPDAEVDKLARSPTFKSAKPGTRKNGKP
jgi:transcriptional regulator with XRE-family HTH domain